jgi:hypothetical protein
MSPWNRWILATALLLPAGSALADRGDVFLSLAPAIDAFEPGFGGALGLQFGVNPETDLFAEYNASAADPGSGDWDVESSFLFGSFYTPYSGEIRPRLGGSLGLLYQYDDEDDLEEVGLNLGVHLQGLFDVSDAVRLFAEAHPSITFGEEGEFSVLAKAGILFRLSK